MKEPHNLFNSVISKNISEISTDVLEAGIDQLISNEFLKDIPILSLGFKTYSLTRQISDSIFTKKIIRFLFQLKDILQQQREKFIKSLEEDNKRQKAGETLLGIINKLDDITKATILGKLFKATIEEKISYEDFTRLSNIVDKVYLTDLLLLVHNQNLVKIDIVILDMLCQAGIISKHIKDNRKYERWASQLTGSTFMAPPGFEYKVNNFGLMLIKFGLK